MRLMTLTGRSYLFEPDERGDVEVRLVLAELQPTALGLLADCSTARGPRW